MTAYRFSTTTQPQRATAAQEAKAKRQAVLQRVRKQRVQAYKRTVAEGMEEGVLVRASELKERYTDVKPCA
jgi:hypothetical protein